MNRGRGQGGRGQEVGQFSCDRGEREADRKTRGAEEKVGARVRLADRQTDKQGGEERVIQC